MSNFSTSASIAMHTLPPAGSIAAIYNLLRMPVPPTTIKPPKPSPQPVQATPANDATHPAIDPDVADVVVIDTPTVPARNFYTDWQAAAESADPVEAKRVLGQSILSAKASAQAAGNTELVGKIDGMIARIDADEQAAKSPPADAPPKVYDSLEDMLNSGATVQFGDSPTHDANALRTTERSQRAIDKPQPADTTRPPQPPIPDSTKQGMLHRIDEESIVLLQYISTDFVLYASKGGRVAYHVEDGDELPKDAFIAYSDKHYADVCGSDKEGNPVRCSAGLYWWNLKEHTPVAHRVGRRVVRQVIMEPTSLPESDDNPEKFNRWHLLKQKLAEPDMSATRASIEPLENHLLYLSDADQVGVDYTLNWLAQLWRQPGIKIPTALALYSPLTRIGKNLFVTLVRKTFGGKHLVGSGSGNKMLTATFDDGISDKWIVNLNEVRLGGKNRDAYDNFKTMISEEDGSFEGKGSKRRDGKHVAHYIITTNHADALPLSDSDGRILVLRCTTGRRPDQYYKGLMEWINGPGPSLLAGAFQNWVFPKNWDPYAPVPQTEATQAMQETAKGELYAYVRDGIAERRPPFDRDFATVEEVCIHINGNDQNVLGYRVTWTSVGKVLKAHCGAPKATKISSKGTAKKQMLYFFRDAEQWALATPEQRGAHRDNPYSPRVFAVQPEKAEVSDE